MPKFAKTILIALSGVVVLFAVGLMGVNLYLQSDGVQERIHSAVSRSLGAEIQIGRTSLTPWGGFTLGDVSMPDPENPGKNLLEAQALRIRFRWLPLLSGKVVVSEARLEKPTLVARQTADKRWVVMVPPPPSPEIPLSVQRSDSSPSGPTFTVRVERVAVSGGRALFINSRGLPVLEIDGADMEADLTEDYRSNGKFLIGLIRSPGGIRPENLGGTFQWDGSVLQAPSITGSLAGGEIAASYFLESGISGSDPRFSLSAQVHGVELEELARQGGAPSDGTRGTLKGSLKLEGDPLDASVLSGNARIELLTARLRPVDFLVQIGQVFGIEELQMLELEEAFSDLTVRGNQVSVDGIVLRSENLVLSGEGTAELDGSIDLQASLMINKKLQRQLKAALSRSDFKQSEDPEYKQLDFEVTNTLSHPKTDLLDKLVGVRIGQDVGGLLKNLFGPPKRKSNDE